MQTKRAYTSITMFAARHPTLYDRFDHVLEESLALNAAWTLDMIGLFHTFEQGHHILVKITARNVSEREHENREIGRCIFQ
jgi:hypothetical protein